MASKAQSHPTPHKQAQGGRSSQSGSQHAHTDAPKSTQGNDDAAGESGSMSALERVQEKIEEKIPPERRRQLGEVKDKEPRLGRRSVEPFAETLSLRIIGKQSRTRHHLEQQRNVSGFAAAPGNVSCGGFEIRIQIDQLSFDPSQRD